MCLAYPGIVSQVDGKSVVVDYPSGKKTVLLGIKNVHPGDRVLVQMGVIIKKLSKKENDKIIEAWCSLS